MLSTRGMLCSMNRRCIVLWLYVLQSIVCITVTVVYKNPRLCSTTMYHVLCSWTFKTHPHTEYSPFDLQISSLQKHLRKLASTELILLPLSFTQFTRSTNIPYSVYVKWASSAKETPPKTPSRMCPSTRTLKSRYPRTRTNVAIRCLIFRSSRSIRWWKSGC